MNFDKQLPGEEKDFLYRIIVLRLAFIFVVISAALFLLLFHSSYLFDPHRYLLLKLLSLGHIPLFCLIAWMVLLAINLKKPAVYEWPFWSYIAAFLFVLGISFLLELVQIITPRDSSVKDFFFNTLGATLFLCAALLWTNKEFSMRAGKWNRRVQLIFIIVTILIFTFIIRPLVLLVIDEVQIRRSFPVIGSFETKREIKRWNGGNNELSLSQKHADHGKYSLRVTLYPAKYSGIHIAHPPSNWCGFDTFDFMAFNPSRKRVRIVLKIFDWEHNYNYSDRFNKLIYLSPGKNYFSIPLKEIELAPAKRKMKMDKIGQISFFVKDLKHKQILYFDNIRLSKGKRF